MPKTCCYPNCPSDNNTENRSLFSFPVRDRERRCQWMTILGCSEEDAASRMCGVCDLHFDSKYIVSNPRRRTLIGMALPKNPSAEQTMPKYAVGNTFEFHCFGDQLHGAGGDSHFVDEDKEDGSITLAIDYVSNDDMDAIKHDEMFDEGVSPPVETIMSDCDQDVDASEGTTTTIQKQTGTFETCMTGGVLSSDGSDNELLASVARPHLSLSKITASSVISIESHTDLAKTTPHSVTRSPAVKRQRIKSEAALEEYFTVNDVHVEMPVPTTTQSSEPAKASSTTNQPRIQELPTQAKLVSVRGVDYVQMPLYVYEAEKKSLRDELLYWKNIVAGFKADLDDVEF